MEGHANIASVTSASKLGRLCQLLCNRPALDDLARTHNGDKGERERQTEEDGYVERGNWQGDGMVHNGCDVTASGVGQAN
jgi:hypothetical protein